MANDKHDNLFKKLTKDVQKNGKDYMKKLVKSNENKINKVKKKNKD